MKVLLVLGIVLIAAATALAYSVNVATGASMVAVHASRTEATTLILSGSLLIGIAGAVRRWPL